MILCLNTISQYISSNVTGSSLYPEATLHNGTVQVYKRVQSTQASCTSMRLLFPFQTGSLPLSAPSVSLLFLSSISPSIHRVPSKGVSKRARSTSPISCREHPKRSSVSTLQHIPDQQRSCSRSRWTALAPDCLFLPR